MTDVSTLRAITLDLDDTLWPVGPTLVAAERVLADWLAAHAPATATTTDVESRAAVRRALMAEFPERAHDMSFIRLEGLRRTMAAAGDDPSLADLAFEVFLDARQQVVPFDDVEPVLARWGSRWRLVALTNGNADVGRTPLAQGIDGGGNKTAAGRDHHKAAFTTWLAGGGVKRGLVHGSTDDFGFAVAEKPVHVHDLNATILHLLGLEHTKLTFRHQGREYRLTDVHGEVVRDILA